MREHYGIGKYLPPVRFDAGDAEPNHPLFERYTAIENLRHFPMVIQPEEEIILTEKIHGTNVRLGLIEGVMLAGSHGLQRKRPAPEALATHTYWFPSTLESVATLLDTLRARHRQVILFGEVYGSRVQKLDYGQKGTMGFAAFDLFTDGKYVAYDVFQDLCTTHGVPTVPELGRGLYSLEFVQSSSRGRTTLPGQHIREGVVVRPARERTDARLGRVIFKYINDDYLLNT
ncbi:MAG: hypothetical protein FJZ47_12875, partial [Candidatus Tectomicrobia bacterium]|nr:hypothetical protein [Candidatus Tectomicrobia bacterium]